MRKSIIRVKSSMKNIGKYVITCRLDDECKNGVEDFSITYDYFEKGRNGHWYNRGGGCGSDLYKEFGELELICKLHLAKFNGVPMYAVENGMYFIKQGEIETAKEHLRVTDEEINILRYIYDPIDFKCALIDMGIVKRWKDEADECIKWLSGNDEPFVSKAGDKYDFKVSDEEMNSYLNKKKKGVYSQENYENKRMNDLVDMVNKKYVDTINHIEERYKDDIDEEKKKLELRMRIVKNSTKPEHLLDTFYFLKGELKFYSFSDINQEEKEQLKKLAKGI